MNPVVIRSGSLTTRAATRNSSANTYRIAQIDAKTQQQIVGNSDGLSSSCASAGSSPDRRRTDSAKVSALDGNQNGNVAARGCHADGFGHPGGLDPFGSRSFSVSKVGLGRPERQPHGNVGGHQRSCFA